MLLWQGHSPSSAAVRAPWLQTIMKTLLTTTAYSRAAASYCSALSCAPCCGRPLAGVLGMLVPEEATSCAPCRYSATRCCAGAASSVSRDKAALQPQKMVVMAFDCHKPQAAHGILVCQVARCLQVLCLLALHSASAQLQHHLSWRLMHTAHLSAACMTLASPEQEHLCIHCLQTAVVLL